MSKSIGFIGTGVMGASIVKHLLTAGFKVTVFNRSRAKAEVLLSFGANVAQSVAETVKGQDIVFTMVSAPSDVEQVYFGEQGILANVKEGAVVIDMTTSEPSLAKKIDSLARENNIASLDAPVSGGDIGAQNGTLSIMVGGDRAVFEQLYPIFQVFGQNIVYQGTVGAGQHTKMCNQIVAATTLIGVCESIMYGIKAGLSMEEVLKSISSGAAGSWALSNLGPKIVQGDDSPGFYIKHMLKDLKIALVEAEKLQLNLPGLSLAKNMFETLERYGYGEKGTQALIHYYEKQFK